MVLLALASSAVAATPEYAVMVPRRPPTLPKNDVRITVNGQVGTESPNAAHVLAGAALGITDELEVGAWVLPLDVSPNVAYLDPSLYAAYGGELSKNASLTPLLRLFVPVTSTSATLLDAQVKLALDAGKSARFTVAPTTTVHFVDGGPNTGFGAPIALTLQAKSLFATLQSGLGTDAFSWQYQAVRPGASDWVVPAGLQVGGPAGKPKKGAIVDVSGGVFWPALVADGAFDASNLTLVAEISTNLLGDRRKGGKSAKD